MKVEGENTGAWLLCQHRKQVGEDGVQGKKEVTGFSSRARGVRGALRIPGRNVQMESGV